MGALQVDPSKEIAVPKLNVEGNRYTLSIDISLDRSVPYLKKRNLLKRRVFPQRNDEISAHHTLVSVFETHGQVGITILRSPWVIVCRMPRS